MSELDEASAVKARRAILERQKNELEKSFGNGAFHDGLVRQRIEDIDRQLAALSS